MTFACEWWAALMWVQELGRGDTSTTSRFRGTLVVAGGRCIITASTERMYDQLWRHVPIVVSGYCGYEERKSAFCLLRSFFSG